VRCPISSYQDVDWGYNTNAPITDNPLPLSAIDEYLDKFGYKRLPPADPLAPEYFYHWVKPGAPTITMAAPQFRAEGYYDTLVYDIHDIRDMLEHLDSDEFDGPNGHELQAKHRPVS
jgi:hypothetical protein